MNPYYGNNSVYVHIIAILTLLAVENHILNIIYIPSILSKTTLQQCQVSTGADNVVQVDWL